MFNMFSKKAPVDLKKLVVKLNDPKKDLLNKIKYVKTIIEFHDFYEIKNVFEENYYVLYHIFNDYFYEVSKPKSYKLYREELDIVFNIFEIILYTLPELLNQRWQYNSIYNILAKICHLNNNLKIKKIGIKLFTTWYQILLPTLNYTNQENWNNCENELDMFFSSIIPGLHNENKNKANQLDLLSLNSSLQLTTSNYFPSPHASTTNIGLISGKIINTSQISKDLMPIAIEPEPYVPISEESTLEEKGESALLLEVLLEASIWQGQKIMWSHESFRQQASMKFLEKIRLILLPLVFPSFTNPQRYNLDIYSPTFNPMNIVTTAIQSQSPIDGHFQNGDAIKGRFIKWLLKCVRHPDHTCESHVTGAEQNHLSPPTEVVRVEKKGSVTASPPTSESRPGSTGPNHSVLARAGSSIAQEVLSISSDRSSSLSGETKSSPSKSLANQPLIGKMPGHEAKNTNTPHASLLCTSQVNVNFVLEILRMGLQMQHSAFEIKEDIVQLYRSWILEPEFRPPFMQEEAESFGIEASPSAALLNPSEDHHLGAGFQRSVRTLLCSAAQVFLITTPRPSLISTTSLGPNHDEEYELCKRVLNLFRQVVMATPLNQYSWRAVITILLEVIKTLKSREEIGSNGGAAIFQFGNNRLLGAFIQTLLVTFIKACLNIRLSDEVWEDLSATLKSLIGYDELFVEWSKTMDTLIRIYARQVFGLDLSNLPSDRLTEQKCKKRRGQLLLQSSSQIQTSTSLGQSIPAPDPPVRIKNYASSSRWGPERPQSTPLPPPPLCQVSTNVAPRTSQTATSNLEAGARLSLCPTVSYPASTADHLVETGTASQFFGMDNRATIKKIAPDVPPPPSKLTQTKDEATPPSPTHLSSLKSFSSQASDASTATSMGNGDLLLMSNGTVIEGGSIEVDSNLDEEDDDRFSSASREESDVLSSYKDENLMHYYDDPIAPHQQTQQWNGNDTTLTDMDNVKSDQTVIGTVINGDSRDASNTHVLLGGTVTGWNSQSADYMWKRMLAILGNPNDITDSRLKYRLTTYLSILFDNFAKIRENQHITSKESYNHKQRTVVSRPSTDDVVDTSTATNLLQSITPNSMLLDISPPMDHLLPWLLQACSLHVTHIVNEKSCDEKTVQTENLDPQYIVATVGLLVKMTFRLHERVPGRDYLSKFYYVMMRMLSPLQKDCGIKANELPYKYSLLATTSILAQASRDIYARYLPACTLLLQPLVEAALAIIESATGQDVVSQNAQNLDTINAFTPTVGSAKEALTFLSRMLIFSLPFKSLDPDGQETSLQNWITSQILCLNGAPKLNSDCKIQVMRSITILVFHNQCRGIKFSHFDECLNFLITMVQDENYRLSSFAAQCLRSLSPLMKIGDELEGNNFLPVGQKIIKELCDCLNVSSKALKSVPRPSQQVETTLIDLMFCLAEWALLAPQWTDMDLVCETFRNLAAQTHLTPDGAYSSPNRKTVSPSSTTGTSPPLPAFEQKQLISNDGTETTSRSIESRRDPSPIVVSTADYLARFLTYHATHFPIHPDGLARLDCLGLETPALTSDTLQAPNIQFFILDNACLISFSETEQVTENLGEKNTGRYLYVTVRDQCGKFIWKFNPDTVRALNVNSFGDTSIGLGNDTTLKEGAECLLPQSPQSQTASNSCWSSEKIRDPDSTIVDMESPLAKSSPIQGTDPIVKSSPTSNLRIIDPLETVLKALYERNPELFANLPCNVMFKGDKNQAALSKHPLYPAFQLQAATDKKLSFCSEQYAKAQPFYAIECPKHNFKVVDYPPYGATTQSPLSTLRACRQFLQQTGFFTWSNRRRLDLCQKNGQFLRQLKHLDSLVCRETHKVAVIYVGVDQDDKNHILSNICGSLAYERFVSGLGVEVSAKSHRGFLGGLSTQSDQEDVKAIYYANATTEIIYHVSTRMNLISNENNIHFKLKHIGNDEIHVVWCDNVLGYRKSTIPTEFCDVLIIISPVPEYTLFRISIASNLQDAQFGPLFDGALVDESCLAPLMRETVLNASRVKKACTQSFQHNYQTRTKCLANIVSQHTQPATFEQLVFSTFYPHKEPNTLQKRVELLQP